MSTTKKESNSKRKNGCWPGYEPVPGKEVHEQGSCRPKAEVKLSTGEKEFRKARRRQLDTWERTHPGKKRKAAQHLHAPKERTSSRSTKKP